MAVVLNPSELQRLKNIANSVAIVSSNDAKALKIAELKKKSQARLENWPNTIEAIRKKKETYSKDRAEQEEILRKEIDIQEAKERKEQREEAIRRANELMLAQTDRMKLLGSAKLYTEVLGTRKQQVVHKQKMRQEILKEDSAYHDIILKKVADGEDQERAKLKRHEEAIEAVAEMRRRQVDEVLEQRALLRKESQEIGEMYKKLAFEDEKKAYEEITLRQLENKNKNFENKTENERLRIIRDDKRARERLEILAKEAEQDIIEDRKNARKLIEKNRFEKQQLIRQHLIDVATKNLQMQKSEEDERLERQVAEQRANEDAREAKKEADAASLWKAIVEDRAAQLESKERQRQRDLEEDLRLLKLRNDERVEGNRREMEKRQRETGKAIALQEAQRQQALERQRLQREERARALEEDRIASTAGDEEVQRFSELCKSEIDKTAAQGKAVYPLLRALEYSQPELIAAKTKPLDGSNKKE